MHLLSKIRSMKIFSSPQTPLQISSNKKEQDEVLTTFTIFNKLPKELRLMIWNLAMPHFPRIILVQKYACRRLVTMDRNNGVDRSHFPKILNTSGCHARTNHIATLLCVNQEARYELLRQYYNPFAKKFCGPGIVPLENLLINYNIDILFLAAGQTLSHGLLVSMLSRRQLGQRNVLTMFEPKRLLEMKKHEEEYPSQLTFWSGWEGCTRSNRFLCAHSWEYGWLKDFKKLEELAKLGSQLPPEIQHKYIVRFAGDQLFGDGWLPYLRSTKPLFHRMSRCPRWYLSVNSYESCPKTD